MSASSFNNNSDPYLVLNLSGHRRPITSLAFNPEDSTSLASGSEDYSLMLWKIDYIKDVRCYRYQQHSGIVTDIDYSPKRNIIVSSSSDTTVRLWAPTLQGKTLHYRPHLCTITSVALSNTDKILSSSTDKSSKEYDVHTKKFLRSYVGHNHWVRCSRYSPESDLIASCSDDRTVRIWDPNVQESVHVLQTGKSSGTKLAFNPRTSRPLIAVAMSSGTVRLYDLRMPRLLQHYHLHGTSACNTIAWHPNGAYLLSGGADSQLCIVDALEGRPLYTLEDARRGDGDGGGEEYGVRAVAFSGDGEYFAAGGQKYIKIWKTNFINKPMLNGSINV